MESEQDAQDNMHQTQGSVLTGGSQNEEAINQMIDASKAEEFMQRITPGNELDDMEGVSHSQGSQSQRPMSQS